MNDELERGIRRAVRKEPSGPIPRNNEQPLPPASIEIQQFLALVPHGLLKDEDLAAVRSAITLPFHTKRV